MLLDFASVLGLVGFGWHTDGDFVEVSFVRARFLLLVRYLNQYGYELRSTPRRGVWQIGWQQPRRKQGRFDAEARARRAMLAVYCRFSSCKWEDWKRTTAFRFVYNRVSKNCSREQFVTEV
jgi:hypothetical protein